MRLEKVEPCHFCKQKPSEPFYFIELGELEFFYFCSKECQDRFARAECEITDPQHPDFKEEEEKHDDQCSNKDTCGICHICQKGHLTKDHS